ncbi:MAG: hypothetical protein PHP54_02305 [Clostridia bacterium]|nr:hypothetical protein [Clostridia bacterium]
MNKKYILTFSISVLVLTTIVIISLMILLPQTTTIVESSIDKYDSISKSEYLYTKTKDISKEALIQQYTISDTEMTTFKNKNQYKPGNSDPFTPASSDTEGEGGSGSGSNAEENTTNSNGGTPNPPSTGK